MADPTADVATDTAANGEEVYQLGELVGGSYARDVGAQGGVSDETLMLVRKYVTELVRAGLEEFLVERSRSYLLEVIMSSLDIGITYRWDIASAIETQIADLATGKASASSDPSQQNVQQAADPIDMFSGQFTQQVTDIVVNGAGMDFVFCRRYKNQAVHYGPLGANWDHSYNLYLRQLGDSLIRSTGEIREDPYTRHPNFGQAGFNYWVPPDGRNGVIEQNGTSFSWRSINGIRYIYQQAESDATFHRIQEIHDRFGNNLAFNYLNDRLVRVEINHQARFVLLEYDTYGRITILQDHTGRQWKYTYDDYGDLVGVTTPTTQRYPHGLTTTYEYSSGEHATPLQHNLLRIFDPAGQLYLENEYGTNRGLLDFNRVTRQRQGKGEYLFEYETVISEFEHDYNASEKPAIQVNQILRNGQPVHFIFNSFGNLLLREEYIWGDGRRRLIQWRYRYNRDGALVGVITPEGNVTQWYYGRDDYLKVNGFTDDEPTRYANLTASARLAFGNLLAVVRRGKSYDLAQMTLNRGIWGDLFPDILAALDTEDIVVKHTYESDFQQILTVSDPRFTARADPRYTEAPSYTQHLMRYEYSALPLKTLRRVRYPDTTFPAPLANGASGLTNIRDEYLKYDSRGRLERVQDPEGTVNENRYFQRGAAATKGYLREVGRDVQGLNLVTTYQLNEVGIPLSVVDPRGMKVTLVVNEMNQTIETISAGPGYRARSFFNQNGLLERQERDNFDDANQRSTDGDEVTTYLYDEQSNLVRGTRGGTDLTKHHIIRHRYDRSDNRVETILPVGNNVRFHYNERLQPASTIRGASSPAASTTRVIYDGDGRKTSSVNGRGHVSRYAYDAFDRVIRTTDPLGNQLQEQHDKLGNLTLTRFFERRSDGTYALLRRSEFDYDERGNQIQQIEWLFEAPIVTADIKQFPDAEFLAVRVQGLATPIRAQFFYDRNRRLFRSVNAKGQETTYDYDGANRRIIERDDVGNYVRTFYDENSNVIRVDHHELVHDPTTSQVIREDVFSNVNEYDALDRRIATTDGLGNRTTFTYDSRDNIASVTDPLGNVKRAEYDAFNRRVRDIQEMTATGLGGGSRLPDIVSRFIYDDNDRLISVVDAKGNPTQFAYDDLDRLIQITYVDGSNVHLTPDADDNVSAQKDNNGLQVLQSFDPSNRRTRVDLDRTGVTHRFSYPPGAEDYESYAYDGLGRLLQQENNHCSITSTFDSLGRAYNDRVMFKIAYRAPRSALTLRRSFDALSNRTNVTYPSGRAIYYDYDRLNRIKRIANTSSGTNYPGSATLPAQYDVANYQYRGRRLAKATFGNQAGYELAYDSTRRVISIHHQVGGNTLLDLKQLFDGAGNRRYQFDIPVVGAQPNGEVYAFDSLYRLTKTERRTLVPINPVQFEPPSAPLPVAAMVGQQMIDNALGSLAQNPSDFTYRYDALGNRKKERQPGQPTTTSASNSLNQIVSVGGVLFGYDLNGNMTDDGTRLYRYNYRNQLVQVVEKTTAIEVLRLLYDAAGLLVGIREAGQMTCLVNDGFNVIEEYTDGNVSRQYVYENGIDRRCQMASSAEEWWYHGDILRSTRWLTDSSGQVAPAGRFKYEPFGSIVGSVTHDNPYLYAGKRLIKSVGLYDYRTRQYLPDLGRFLQRDPKGGVDGPNLYVYVANNPVTFTDLLGTEKGMAMDDPKPFAEEYYRTHYKMETSLREQTQLGGLIRAFVYLNPVSIAGPENIERSERMIDQLVPYQYALEDLERAKQHEMYWSMFFSELIFAPFNGALAGEAAAMRLAAQQVARSAAPSRAGMMALEIEAEALRRSLIRPWSRPQITSYVHAPAPPSRSPFTATQLAGSFEGFPTSPRVYGPFFRIGDAPGDYAAAIASQSWGGRGINSGGRGIRAALAYTEAAGAIQNAAPGRVLRFYTHAKPDVGPGGVVASWSDLSSEFAFAGTIKGEDAVFIKILLARIQ